MEIFYDLTSLFQFAGLDSSKICDIITILKNPNFIIRNIRARATHYHAEFVLRAREKVIVKSKPDFLLILMAVFGLGVAVTLVAPVASSKTVSAPASELQAGVIIQR